MSGWHVTSPRCGAAACQTGEQRCTGGGLRDDRDRARHRVERYGLPGSAFGEVHRREGARKAARVGRVGSVVGGGGTASRARGGTDRQQTDEREPGKPQRQTDGTLAERGFHQRRSMGIRVKCDPLASHLTSDETGSRSRPRETRRGTTRAQAATNRVSLGTNPPRPGTNQRRERLA